MPYLRSRISALTVVLLLTSTGLASAQVDRGTITGTVTDSTGGIVAKASVKAVHVATNFERTVTTSDQGTYTIPQLQVGFYVVIVTATGFQTTTFENVEVTAGGTARVDGTLAVGGLQDAVTVSGESKQIRPTASRSRRRSAANSSRTCRSSSGDSCDRRSTSA
jgi:hypothetical protein